MTTIRISEYQPEDQDGIDHMMESLALEYSEPISGPQSVRIFEAYRLPGQKYWVAHAEDQVVGTVGLILLSSGNAVLKRMMTHKNYRGHKTNLAKRLLDTSLEWGRVNGVQRVYFGTMDQFKAAQKFYLKHNAVVVSLDELPSDMAINPIDTIHYRLDLPLESSPSEW